LVGLAPFIYQTVGSFAGQKNDLSIAKKKARPISVKAA
jgi:hypothetical protein